MGVATPTGVLEGVAAFGWDGSQWQPSGRAAYGVGTPTGVLRGVAPFTWSGSAWTPAGRAGPSVPTSSGVLQGVAVYIWNGSAWTPAGGGPGSATPTGVLRGVAAFSWDGTAWQPAGQAGPDVATPFGVLQGVAMFNWNGSAWAVPAPPSLSLNFMTPGTLPPNVTVTRAGTATYFDVAGTLQTAAANAPRWDYDPVSHALRGLLVEDGRTNLLLNSAVLGTQSATVTAAATTLSFYGTGSVAYSGVATGTLVGAGAFPQRAAVTFTPTAGTLTLTVTGSVLNAQLETGTAATSWIPTTGTTVARAIDVVGMPNDASFNATTGTWQAEFIPNGAANVSANIVSGNIGSPTIGVGTDGRLNASIRGAATVLSGLGPLFTMGAVNKTAFAYLSGASTGATNGTAVGPVATTFTISGTTVRFGTDGQNSLFALNGWIRRAAYWPRQLSSSELVAATT
jgi:hypothetical protein